MAISISVSEIRSLLSRSSEHASSGDGTPTTAALGNLFHRVASELLKADSDCSLQVALRDQDRELKTWQEALKKHTYDHLLGPLLTQAAASLAGHGCEVIHLWTATQQLTDWLANRWWEITRQGTIDPDQNEWMRSEQPIVCELNRKGWKEPVMLLGQTDAVIRIPSNGHWCVIDWKTGRTTPQIDLLQACLYHLMLCQNGSSAVGSAIAVISFRPELNESVFTYSQIIGVQSRLLDVVEKLAQNRRTTASETAKASREQVKQVTAPMRPSEPQSTQQHVEPTPTEASGKSIQWQREALRRITQVLTECNSPVRELREPAVGPTFVRFFVTPEKGVTVKKVLAAGEQLHLRLALASEPVMGVVEGAIAVDLPRPDREKIAFSSLLPHLPDRDATNGNAKIPVGVNLNGKWVWCDLSDSESCHMLVVGTPGSGKSEWLRTALASLLMTNTPETLELLLIDPKRNAFAFAENSPLLRQPIMIPGLGDSASEVLGALVEEMEQRNALLQSSNSKTLREHVLKTGEATKRIVVICDEYAALLDSASKKERSDIEKRFKQLAQLGRAPGFHLILATQQPRTTIITPAIRSLLPAKVALRVSDGVESRVALEQNGAQQLFGNGDLYFKCIGTQRLQGAWLPTSEEELVGLTGWKPIPRVDRLEAYSTL